MVETRIKYAYGRFEEYGQNENMQKLHYIKTKALAYQYQMTDDQFKALMKTQGNKCPICLCVFDTLKVKPYIDHDHSCCAGQVTCGSCIRGILCNACNSLLGKLKDSTKALQRAIDYLDKPHIVLPPSQPVKPIPVPPVKLEALVKAMPISTPSEAALKRELARRNYGPRRRFFTRLIVK
jgi:hypothetical protein